MRRTDLSYTNRKVGSGPEWSYNRLLATALHYFGDQRQARHHIDRALAQLAALARQPQIVRVRFDMRVSTHYFQARILWLQGFAEQALRVVEHNIEEGNAVGQALTFCSVLGQAACPIALWAGNLDAAERYGAMLLDHTERHPIRLWQIRLAWHRCQGVGVVENAEEQPHAPQKTNTQLATPTE